MTPSDSTWLDPLRWVLDRCPADSSVWFFRDDDAGWADEQLWPLIDVFSLWGVTLDVAAIPAALHAETGRRLGRMADEGTVAVHQHGWSHTNHEKIGRACEFGPGRSVAEQEADLIAGRAALENLVGAPAASTFVPPWNRCSPMTVELLCDLGFTGLSRDITAPAAPMVDVPVSLDWTRVAGTGGAQALGDALAEVSDRSRANPHECTGNPVFRPVGVMLHHDQLGTTDLRALGQLLELLESHPAVRCTTLALLTASVGASAGSDR